MGNGRFQAILESVTYLTDCRLSLLYTCINLMKRTNQLEIAKMDITFNPNNTVAIVKGLKIKANGAVNENDLGFFKSTKWVVSLIIEKDCYYFTANDGKNRFRTEENKNFSDLGFDMHSFRSHKDEVENIVYDAIENWLNS